MRSVASRGICVVCEFCVLGISDSVQELRLQEL